MTRKDILTALDKDLIEKICSLSDSYLSSMSGDIRVHMKNEVIDLKNLLVRVSKAENRALAKFAWLLFRGSEYPNNPVEKNEKEALRLKTILAAIGDSYDVFEYAKMVIYSQEAPNKTALQRLESLSLEGFLPAASTLAKMYSNGRFLKLNKKLSYEYAKRSIELGGSVGHRIRLSYEFVNGSFFQQLKIAVCEYPFFYLRHLFRSVKNPTDDRTLY